mgnify:CR=1 FL=1
MTWWVSRRLSSHLVRWLFLMMFNDLLYYNLLNYDFFFNNFLFNVMFFTSLSKAASFRIGTIACRAAAQYENH